MVRFEPVVNRRQCSCRSATCEEVTMTATVAILQVLGVLAVMVGIAMWSVPLMLVVLGVVLVVGGVQVERQTPPKGS
jgi:hypothetical protein